MDRLEELHQPREINTGEPETIESDLTEETKSPTQGVRIQGDNLDTLPDIQADTRQIEDDIPEISTSLPELDTDFEEESTQTGSDRIDYEAITKQEKKALKDIGLDADEIELMLPHVVDREIDRQTRQLQREKDMALAERLGMTAGQAGRFKEAQMYARKVAENNDLPMSLFRKCNSKEDVIRTARKEARARIIDYPKIKKMLELREIEAEGGHDVSMAQSGGATVRDVGTHQDARQKTERQQLRETARDKRARASDKRRARIKLLDMAQGKKKTREAKI